MICAWKEFLSILPESLALQIDDNLRNDLLEMRLRIGRKPELVLHHGSEWLSNLIKTEDLKFIINAASRYSPWASTTIARGFITAPGGHRIGICGECVIKDEHMKGIRIPSSLCIRLAKNIENISAQIGLPSENLLILGPPGSGKTTLLRDLIRQISDNSSNSITVIDENMELFPKTNDVFSFSPGLLTDVMSGCSKAEGLNISIKTMNPTYVAVDEITSIDDCNAVINAHGCGVKILATAHADSVTDLNNRPIYRKLMKEQVFKQSIVLKRDKSWHHERILKCT